MTQLEIAKSKLSVSYIREKAEKHYWKSFLSNYIQSIPYERFEIPFGKMPNLYKDILALKDNMTLLRERYSINHTEFYQIEEDMITTRDGGKQTIFKKVMFLSEPNFLQFLEKTKQAKQARENFLIIANQLPELKDFILNDLNLLIEIEDTSNWADMIKVCRYFLDSHIPNKFYIRELKIQVHTKFIEENEKYLKRILNSILPDDKINQDESKFAQRFKCKVPEELIRLKFLDPTLMEKYKISFTDFGIPLSEFVQLNFVDCNILILENKVNFYILQGDFTFPNTIIIFGSGFGVLNYKDKQEDKTLLPIEWLKNNRIFYWGDLDSAGFEILSKFRHTYPHTVSVLMDRQTYSTFEPFAHVIEPTKEDTPQKLTDSEYELYTYLKQNNLRLEQEKLTHEYIKTGLEKILNSL